MKKDFNFENAKLGNKVYHIVLGWVEVTDNDGCAFEVCDEHWFNYDGKEKYEDENPTIYPHNPFEQNKERVVETSNFISWKEKTNVITCPRGYWREIQPQKKLTQKEKINILWDKYGKEL